MVLLGRFNPRIFQPMWFEARGLLADVDVEPESLVLTDGFVAFQTPVISVLCAQDRCQFAMTSLTPTPDLIRDVVLGTFAILSETPVWEIGINHAAQIPAQVRRWDEIVAQFGDPQKALELLPGQSLLTIELRAPRDDELAGELTLRLQPSMRLEGGIWFSVNDHVIVRDSQEPKGAGEAMATLDDMWGRSRELWSGLHGRLAPS